jgi:hypothetical protein
MQRSGWKTEPIKTAKTMFNLEQAIAEWRRQMLAAGIKTPSPMDELESHLREEIEKQIQNGVATESAFTIAVQKIGHAKMIEAEFKKTGLLKEMRHRKLKRLSLVFSALCYAAPIVLNAPHLFGGMDRLDRRLALVAFGLTILSLASGLFLHSFLPVIMDKRVRTRIQVGCCAAGLVWLLAFFFRVLPAFELSLGHLQMIILWAMLPLAVCSGFAFGLDEAVHRRQLELNDKL